MRSPHTHFEPWQAVDTRGRGTPAAGQRVAGRPAQQTVVLANSTKLGHHTKLGPTFWYVFIYLVSPPAARTETSTSSRAPTCPARAHGATTTKLGHHAKLGPTFWYVFICLVSPPAARTETSTSSRALICPARATARPCT